MNLKKLKRAEAQFLKKYPDGFHHPDMVAMGKKHKMDQMIAMSKDSFAKSRFSNPDTIVDNMVKIIGRSSMVSMFEKPKFKDFVATLSENERVKLANSLKQLLHGNQEKGFIAFVKNMKQGNLAKWSLVTVLPNYFRPDDEVFVKPTTAKGVIQYFEIDQLEYKPAPSWSFYTKYKEEILEMRSMVDQSISPNNAAFCGFLMMSLDGGAADRKR